MRADDDVAQSTERPEGKIKRYVYRSETKPINNRDDEMVVRTDMEHIKQMEFAVRTHDVCWKASSQPAVGCDSVVPHASAPASNADLWLFLHQLLTQSEALLQRNKDTYTRALQTVNTLSLDILRYDQHLQHIFSRALGVGVSNPGVPFKGPTTDDDGALTPSSEDEANEVERFLTAAVGSNDCKLTKLMAMLAEPMQNIKSTRAALCTTTEEWLKSIKAMHNSLFKCEHWHLIFGYLESFQSGRILSEEESPEFFKFLYTTNLTTPAPADDGTPSDTAGTERTELVPSEDETHDTLYDARVRFSPRRSVENVNIDGKGDGKGLRKKRKVELENEKGGKRRKVRFPSGQVM